MKSAVSVIAASSALLGVASASVQGFDISNYQGNIDWSGAYNSGARFVIIKATEGTDYIDSGFNSHYTGATNAGFIRGGYHFAHPDSSSGADQANYFLAHGGGWSADGITLPGMLDIEYAPSGNECYGLSASDMVSWITDFVNTYESATGRYPMIYSTNDWWSTCTGNSDAFSSNSPLVLADYNSSPGTIPGGWPYQTIWQNSDSYAYGGDSDVFNGDETALKKIASG
ncbi:glycoside hydrolase family 25 protein [Talaromyces proteolyticus]|uniref:Lysozyme n=1 Tax=Talaromyces proteolyticus TaxID=1131652 RepID=A0AAD4KYU6_9EURO|nr:glycoside hydrolase family 25 protein [Talaromyces proteolyticus]KAH8703118.1 glycoside hydrolase family 25 protein [Talaromyces proteolyticus]